MRQRILVTVLLLAAYSLGITAFAFHSHENTFEHVNCKICHVAGSSEKAASQNQPKLVHVPCGFVPIENDSPIFRFLNSSSGQRAPPLSAS